MVDRTVRVWITILLTVMDIVIFGRFFGVVWQAWSGVTRVRAALSLLLTVWTGSAAILWLHVFFDIREFLHRHRSGMTLNLSQTQCQIRRGRDV